MNAPFMGFLPCLSRLSPPLLVLPGITSQINVLHLNPRIGSACEETQTKTTSNFQHLSSVLCQSTALNTSHVLTHLSLRQPGLCGRDRYHLHFTDAETDSELGLEAKRLLP